VNGPSIDDIHTFLAADEACLGPRVPLRRNASLAGPKGWMQALPVAEAAFDALLPPHLRGQEDLYCDEDTWNRYVWMPLLTAEYDGDEEAAQVAWALGERPAEHPETVIQSRPWYRAEMKRRAAHRRDGSTDTRLETSYH
jgi:hypothetical protein